MWKSSVYVALGRSPRDIELYTYILSCTCSLSAHLTVWRSNLLSGDPNPHVSETSSLSLSHMPLLSSRQSIDAHSNVNAPDKCCCTSSRALICLMTLAPVMSCMKAPARTSPDLDPIGRKDIFDRTSADKGTPVRRLHVPFLSVRFFNACPSHEWLEHCNDQTKETNGHALVRLYPASRRQSWCDGRPLVSLCCEA